MAFSITLTDEERQLAESYAKLHSYSLSEAFKRALFEQIEDEYDAAVADAAHEEWAKDGYATIPAEEFWRQLDEEEV